MDPDDPYDDGECPYCGAWCFGIAAFFMWFATRR